MPLTNLVDNQLIISALTHYCLLVFKGMVTMERSTNILPAQGRVFLCFTSMTPT